MTYAMPDDGERRDATDDERQEAADRLRGHLERLAALLSRPRHEVDPAEEEAVHEEGRAASAAYRAAHGMGRPNDLPPAPSP